MGGAQPGSQEELSQDLGRVSVRISGGSQSGSQSESKDDLQLHGTCYIVSSDDTDPNLESQGVQR